VATQNGQIRNYDVESGTLNWSQDLDFSIFASPVLSETEVFIASYQGIIFKFDLFSGNRLNTIKLKSAIIVTPAFDGDILYVGQADGTFLALNNKLTKPLWSVKRTILFRTISFKRRTYCRDSCEIFIQD